MPESVCLGKSESIGLRSGCLPFSAIPGQSKLFRDYLSNPASLRKYYPSAVKDHDEVAERVPEVLSNYTTDRAALCDILDSQNTEFDGSPTVSDNIARLRAADSVAILTGQQAGLFTGPLYTIYKALTAIRSAEKLRGLGVNAVPVFWVATEDHDFEEVSNAFGVSTNGTLAGARFEAKDEQIGLPVGMIRVDGSIRSVVGKWLEELPSTEFSGELREHLVSAYSDRASLGSSFGKLLAGLLSKYGLVLFDPLDPRAKRLASPIYKAAVERSDEIVSALIARDRELESVGYHAQVLVEDDHLPLFWHDDDGRRRAIKRTPDGRFSVPGTRNESDTEQLVTCAESQPQRLSPGVMLRPVVQDFLFPTLCYFGGGAEISYFAQNSVVYQILGRPVTPIIHRQSFTIVEPKHARTMEKYRLEFQDLLIGFEKLLPKIVEQVIDPETPGLFDEVEEKMNTELGRLGQQLSKIDPTLVDNLATRRRKIIYHIGALRKKFQRARVEKDEVVNRQIRSMFTTLLPNGGLQERTLNFASFADRYGSNFIDWIYDEVDPDNTEHKLIYL
jgi:bacillithiol biosynthesis cysteine-adding enzyme BshC